MQRVWRSYPSGVRSLLSRWSYAFPCFPELGRIGGASRDGRGLKGLGDRVGVSGRLLVSRSLNPPVRIPDATVDDGPLGTDAVEGNPTV